MDEQVIKYNFHAQTLHKNKMLKQVNIDLQALSADNLNNSKNVIKYMHLYLHKFSIFTAFYVLASEVNNEHISVSNTNNLLFDIDKYFKFQLSKTKFHNLTLEKKEIMENFSFWSDISTKILHKILIKQCYLLRLLSDYFTLDMKWYSTLVSLFVIHAQCAINFVNIEAFASPHTDLQELGEVRNVYELAIDIISSAADKCIGIYSFNKENLWSSKAIQLLKNNELLYLLDDNKALVSKTKDRIETLRLRIEKEQAK